MIEVAHVTHQFARYHGGSDLLTVLADVSLSIEDNKFISFLGPSGCGKTTLLRIIDGLETATGGQVTIDGKAISGPSAERAMVFQEFNLMPWRTAQRNIELALEVQGFPRSDRPGIARDTLRQVGLEGFENYYPYQLSGGMKQRVGLARALATGAKYLFMDEPFGALDPQIRELMQIELLKLLDREQRSIIFVTHSVDEAIFLSDQIVMFSARPGRIMEVIDVDLPRPRWTNDEEVKASDAFVHYRQHIWHVLKREIQQAMAEETGSLQAG